MSIKENLIFDKALADQQWAEEQMKKISDAETLKYLSEIIEQSQIVIDSHSGKKTQKYNEFD